MNLKTFLQGPWFQRIVLFVWLVSSALVMFSQKTIDAIVNVTLYGYGLQFSDRWAIPYWTYAHMLYATQFVSIALTAVALASGFLRKENGDRRTPKREKNNDRPASKPEQNANVSVPGREKTTRCTTGISCPTCKKTLSRPLVMLDFSDGKATLVNVCPYCNAVLGKAEEQNESQTIADQGKEVVR